MDDYFDFIIDGTILYILTEYAIGMRINFDACPAWIQSFYDEYSEGFDLKLHEQAWRDLCEDETEHAGTHVMLELAELHYKAAWNMR